MLFRRNPWLIPLIVIAGVALLYFAIVGSRSSIDQSELLGSWVTLSAVFVAVAVAVVVAYVAMRRNRQVEDAAAPRDHRR